MQRAALRPFAWVTRGLRFSQRWALFQAASSERFRMEIEGSARGGPFQLVYRAGDPDHTEDAALLAYRRVRGTWNPTDRAMGQYNAFVDWITRRVFAAHPELDLVRVRMIRVAIAGGTVTDTADHAFDQVRVRR